MIDAVIFDMDGVLSDTQGLHAQVEQEILGRCGVKISAEELTKRYSGVPTRVVFEELLRAHDKHYVDMDKLMAEKWKRLMEVSMGKIVPIPGAKNLVYALERERFGLAVASASPARYIDRVLSELGIRGYFRAAVSFDEVERGKPAPDVFLHAAEKAKLRPEACVVIEDGDAGMKAAKAAGMKCIGLVSEPNSRDYPADILVDDLRGLSVGRIRSL